jgi:two-component system nitrate/nitrite response regulator NarL
MPSSVCVVVHPSRIFREGLTRILARSPFEPACTVPSTEDVPSTISGKGKQVLVLIGVRDSSHLPGALSTTKESFPDAHVVVVGDSTKRGDVTTALELGATSFVDENIDTSALVKKLELVALGAPVISVFILRQLLGQCAGGAPHPADTHERAAPGLQLSSREAAILNGLVQGAPNKVIAYQLKITEATVKVHVKAILRKIRVKNRTQAAIWAKNRQLLMERGAGDNGSPLTPTDLVYAISAGPMPRATSASGISKD